MSIAALLIFFGVLLTLANNVLSFSCHAYQAELYPTRIRARAVGLSIPGAAFRSSSAPL